MFDSLRRRKTISDVCGDPQVRQSIENLGKTTPVITGIVLKWCDDNSPADAADGFTPRQVAMKGVGAFSLLYEAMPNINANGIALVVALRAAFCATRSGTES